MSATNAPFGFRPAYHTSGEARARTYPIATGYAADIFKGDPVKLVDAGTIQLGTSDGTRSGTTDGVGLLGIFMGVEYKDALGKPTYSPYWPSGTAATEIVAYVVDDPETVFEVQAVGSVAAADLGEGVDWTIATGGSTATGLSKATVTAVVATSGQFQIIGFGKQVDNAAGDAFTIVHVRINEHHYKAAVNSI